MVIPTVRVNLFLVINYFKINIQNWDFLNKKMFLVTYILIDYVIHKRLS